MLTTETSCMISRLRKKNNMGKSSLKHSHVKCEKSGCMWSFISMLDFRYGRFAPKMLLDRRYESWYHVGVGNQNNMHHTALDVNEYDQDGEENVQVKRRPSVKELIEEDLLSELLSKSDLKSAEVGLISERKQRRDSSKTTTTHRKGCQADFGFAAEWPSSHKSEDPQDHHSRQLTNPLQIISSDDNFFPRKRSDLLGRNSEELANFEVENNEHSELPAGNNVAEPEIWKSELAYELPASKRHKFFRRKSNSSDKKVSKGNKPSQVRNRIAILQTGEGTLPQSEMTTARSKGGVEGTSSQFSLTEIKKKWKNAMGREALEGDRRFRQTSETSLSGKEHLVNEKIVNKAINFRKVENAARHKGKEHYQVTKLSYPRGYSNIYVEAKKHLSDMLTNNNATQGVKQNAKPLGRILSFPDYNSSSTGSSGIDLWYSFLPARMSLPNIEKLQSLESHTGRISLSSELSDECSDNKAHVSPEPVSTTSDQVGQPHSDPISSTSNEPVCDGEENNTSGFEIQNVHQIVASEEIDIIDYLSETSSCSDTIDDPNVHSSKEFYASTSQSASLATKTCQLELGSKVLLEQPSPVSVIDPLFADEEISPVSTTSQSAKPVRIQFEEVDSLQVDEEICLKMGTEAKDCVMWFIESVLQSSALNWEDFYLMSDSPDQILDPSRCHEMELVPNQLCHDKQLLFDCIDEVLVEVFECYFSCFPRLSLRKPLLVRPVLDMDHTIHEVWERVHWHLIQFPLPHSLEQIVERDIDKDSSYWVDIRRDSQTVIVQITEAIFEDLIEGFIPSCVHKFRRM